ncbi:MAG: amino acid adenylation domain-containing protein, partial [Ruminococcaceae bacterium]|nr:amino acid adenylation domain-containing protein [Oscillospiraceae bacterium]
MRYLQRNRKLKEHDQMSAYVIEKEKKVTPEIEQFNQTACDYPKNRTIVELFEEQAARTPERIALTFETNNLTYAQLNEKANQLAAKLRRLGVQPNDFVAILSERGAELLIALYGILKAGAAYVPMDPTYPKERIDYMLRDCGAKAVVVYQTVVETELPTIDLSQPLEESCENLPTVNQPSDIAYLIYTSGTTGKPKAIMIEHRNVLNYCTQNGYGVFRYADGEHCESILAVTNIVFDIFVTEAIVSLLSGMTVHLANVDEQTNAEDFLALEAVCKAEVLQTTPSRLQMFLAQKPKDERYQHFKYLMLGGEAVSEQLVQRLKDVCPNARIIDVYGPSETTVWSSCADVTNGVVNIGKPISNTQIYILKQTELCPIGEIGELCIAGDGLARGYLNQPELTKEKFIDNPFGEGRLYRTGDLAKWLPDGNIEFLGRIDEQVKIRGHRIELGEIDSVLRTLSGVTDCAVIVRDEQIFAYIVSNEQIDSQSIMTELARHLPEYMLPSGMMQLNQIPITRNGKLDKRALPEIKTASKLEYIAPRNALESLCCELFAQCLGVERVGIDDNFFALGGHSIRAAWIVNRLQEQASITVRDVLSLQTPRKLAQRLQENSNESCESIPQAKIAEFYPMSAAQKRMYFVCQMQPESITYNIPAAWHLDGKIDAEKLEAALEKMLQRHEILRTEFSLFDGEPIQKVRQTVAPNFEVVRDEETSENELIEQFIQPFDLSKAPLLRMKLIEREEGSLLLFDCHHIISDGVSEELFFSELAALYNGEALPLLQRQYKDYSLWMESRELSEQKAYWVGQFSDEIPVLDLPTDFNRPQEQSFDGALIYETIKPELMQQLKALCKRCGVTEYMAFLALTMVLLSKYSRQEDIVVGSAFSGRTHRDTENMLGMFVNTLALRGSVEGEKTFEEFLQQIKEISLKAYENQEYPFEDLLEAVEVRRDISRNPIFDVMLVVQNQEQASLQLNGATARRLTVEDRVSKFDLTFQMEETENGYACGLEYCTALFKEETVRRMLRHYIALLEQATENASCKIAELKAITQEEERRILGEFNATQAEYPKDKTITRLFEEQVLKTPDRIAVSYGEEQLTYVELNRQANRIANTLRAHGIGRNDLVAMLAKRGIRVIAGILGILKAGGAYVPIDPTYPADRINYMLTDCAPKAILTCGATVEFDQPVLDLADESVWSEHDENLPLINTPSDLAYCIYTSGTTGRPKGVLVEHHGVANLKAYFAQKFQVTNNDKILQFANYVFDASVWEWSMALLSGAELVISEDHLDIVRFERNFAKKGITVATLPPNFYAQLHEIKPRLLITAGSASDRGILEKSKDFRYINAYGPTETTICATHWEADKETTTVPIGRPINNVQVYILQGTALCGIGVPGELCVAGDTLARGYLNQAQLTAEKFMPNPFGSGRLYRTGDLAKWLPDGNIEFMGRIDEQIKLRGFRIELGEIESVLRNCNGIVDCAVIVRNDAAGEAALCAYVVSDLELQTEMVKDEMRSSLPEYMLPSYIIQLESIPVTRNGKLDKRALPDISSVARDRFVAPRNQTEQLLCDIFSEILGVETVGIYDRFFSLGGHSLRAARLANRIEEALGCRLTIRQILLNQTPSELSDLISQEHSYQELPLAETREYYQMSAAQRRIYFASHGTAYHMPSCWKISGKLCEKRLKEALATMMRRHEILRTEFLLIDGEPMQKVVENCDVFFDSIKDADTSENELIRDFVRPFDLAKAPLLRMRLIERENESLLLFDVHHIVSDGMSAERFWQEFAAIYHGETLTEPNRQYKDYSQWMCSRDLSEQKAYWLEQFSDEIPVLDLPLDFARPQRQSFDGALCSLCLDAEFLSQVQEFCKAKDITQYMLFVSATMLLMSKYSRQEDIVIGSAFSGRTHKETENMLGMFVGTLALRGRPEKERSVEEFLFSVKELCLKAYENQEYPFEDLVDCLKLRRDMSRNPLFDVMLVVQNNEQQSLSLDGVQAQLLGEECSTSKFDLTFTLEDSSLSLEYCTSLFRKETALRMLRHLVSVVKQMISDTQQKLKNVQAITQEERLQILGKFNDSDAHYPKESTLIDLFAQQVAKTPDRIAVTYKNETLTYAQLNEKANQLAHKLRALGVKPNDLIPMYIERCTEMIVGIYGILKAGAAYVPINTTYPEDRVQFILEDCEAKVLLIGNTPLPMQATCPTIDLHRMEQDACKENCETVNTSEDIAYVIYTSGTTGKPKGVMIEHRNVVRLFINSRFQFDFDENDVWMMFHSYGFDFSVWEMYGATLFGGRLVIVPEEVAKDNTALRDLIRDEGVTVLNQVPSSFYNLQRCCDGTENFKVRYLIFGGEALYPAKLRNWHSWYRGCKIINMYGITETTVHVTYREIGEKEIEVGISDIGSAIPTLQVYILNDGALCGIGVPGELCVAGAGLARGYLHREALTNEKFIANPFGEGRLYRSGDLAKWLPDGNLEYLGRIDDQVKIRGFRIELGEIDSVLRRVDGVKDCAVIVRKDAAGEHAIYAYIVSDMTIDPAFIRRCMKRSIPDYMIPAYMMQIDTIPVTRNGKLDRKALPEVSYTQEYTAPINRTQEILCEIFGLILGVEKVGITDSFFELGGHSLRAARLANAIEEAFGCKLQLNDIFEYSTVEQLANFIESKDESCESIPQAKIAEFYPMSAAQKRMYFVCQMQPESITYNIPAAWHLDDRIDAGRLKAALEKMLQRHEILRTEFSLFDGEPIQKVRQTVAPNFEVVRDEETSENELIEQFIQPFDLSKAPLLRMKLIEREEGSLLLFDCHHIISDGVSEELFFSELAALYNGEALPLLQRQYKDYSLWMESRELSEQKAYWVGQFSDEIPVLDLPTDFNRPQEQSFDGALIYETIKPELMQQLKALCKRCGVTEYMAFLALTMVLLSKYSRQEDIVVGSAFSGRTHRDTENMLGMFVNTLALRGSVEGEKTFEEFLQQIKEISLKAYENQEYPFEDLLEAVEVRRDISRNPIFDVMLVVQNQEQASLQLNGATARRLTVEDRVSKFDLIFQMEETENGYACGLEYCTALFTERTVRRMLKHYIALLEQVTENASCKIAELKAITQEEESKILGEFNATQAEYPKNKTVMELFEAQVEARGDETALVFGSKCLTYRELNERINALAWKLREMGVKREGLVAILPKRSLQTVIGICAILKAGAAYVPIDPSYPEQRIEDILLDCKPKVILTYQASVQTQIPVIDLTDASAFEGKTENPPGVNEPTDAAYCIYTSGTTGRPKGVLIKHHSINNLVMNCDYMPFRKETRTIQTGQLVFDASTFEIWGTLLNGGCLHIITEDLLLDAERFA